MANKASASRTNIPPSAIWLALILASEAVYVLAFLRPFSLLDHYLTPRMDLGKLSDHSLSGGVSYAWAIGFLFLLYFLAFWMGLGSDYATASVWRWLSGLRAAQKGHSTLPWIVAGGLLFAITAAGVYPIGALDVFDNIFYGRMFNVYSANPLLTPPAAFSSDPLYPYVAWYWWPIPYGPLWAAVDNLISHLSGGELLPGLIDFKAFNIALYLACTLLIAALLRRQWPQYALAGTVLFAWNPLVILEGMASVHNDLGLLALLLLALYLHRQGRLLWGLAALLASVLVKFVTLPLVPLYLVASWRRGRGAGFLACQLLLLGLAAGLLYGPYYTPGVSWQAWLTTPFRQAELFTTSLPALAARLLEGLLGQKPAQELVRALALAAWAAFAIWQAWRLWQRRSVVASLHSITATGSQHHLSLSTLALSTASYRVLWFFLLFACLWFQPWYVVWLVALVPLLGPSEEAAAVLLFSLLVHVKYLVFDFAWFWRIPIYDISVPDIATTILIFGPMLLLYTWQAWSARRTRHYKGEQNVQTWLAYPAL